MDRIVKHSQYHFSIKGKYRINFYPTTKTFYIDGSNKIDKNVCKYENVEFLIDLADGKVDVPNSLSEDKSKYKYSPKLRKRVHSKNKKCFVCGKKILDYRDCTLEHKVPLSKGGSNRMDNLAISCRECNFKKGNSLKIE